MFPNGVWRQKEPRMHVPRLLLLTSLLLAFTFAACGGNEETTPGATSTPPAAASPTAEQSPQVTPTAERAQGAALTYISDGAIWIHEAGGQAEKFVETGPCESPNVLDWSPDGERLACISNQVVIWDADGAVVYEQAVTTPPATLVWSPTGDVAAIEEGARITFVDDAGDVIGEIAEAGAAGVGAGIDETSSLWSQAGDRYAYWDEAAGEMRAFNVADGTSTVLMPLDARPLAWVLDDQAMLVATNYRPLQEGQGFGWPEYDAALVYFDESDVLPRPEVRPQFWLSPDRTIAALRADDAEGTVSLMDISSGDVTRIEGSSLNYPSELTLSDVRFTDDGSALVWADVELPTTIYRASVPGGALTMLTPVPGIGAISPEGLRIAYLQEDDGGEQQLYVANADGSDAVAVQPNGELFPHAWRVISD